MAFQILFESCGFGYIMECDGNLNAPGNVICRGPHFPLIVLFDSALQIACEPRVMAFRTSIHLRPTCWKTEPTCGQLTRGLRPAARPCGPRRVRSCPSPLQAFGFFQGILGHEDITTTEIYLHVATGANGLGVISPLDHAGWPGTGD